MNHFTKTGSGRTTQTWGQQHSKMRSMRFLTAAVSEPGDAGGVDGGEPAGVWPE
jgi:hypothetical protein